MQTLKPPTRIRKIKDATVRVIYDLLIHSFLHRPTSQIRVGLRYVWENNLFLDLVVQSFNRLFFKYNIKGESGGIYSINVKLRNTGHAGDKSIE